jgi:anti-sigma regulatory factor (Ser/Thr protein kinase)
VPCARHWVDAQLDAPTVDRRTREAVRLAVTEACTNVVIHAYPDTTDGRLVVAVHLAHGSIVVTVCDDGVGVRPRTDSPGLGCGIALIEGLADTLHIRDRHPGAELRMTFHLATNERPGPQRARNRQ